MPKFYIHSGTFKKTVSRPNYLQALIFIFENLDQSNKRARLGPMISIDQRGYPYDLLNKSSQELLGKDYIDSRKHNGVKMIVSTKDFVPGSGLKRHKNSDILFFQTQQVIQVFNEFKKKK